MAYEGYLTLGGQEMANNARFSVYAEELGVLSGRQGCSCPATASILDDPNYTTPQGDLAPWYSSDEPRSREFAGVMIQELGGLDDGTITRGFTQSMGGGGVPGLPLDTVRTIPVTVVLAAASDAGLSYGLGWLTAQLRSAADCDPSGNGEEMCVWAFCPTPVPDGEAAWQEVARMLYDVTLVDGPRLVQKQYTKTSCAGTLGVIATVEFTLQAGAPGIFHLPTLVGEELAFVPDLPQICDIQWQQSPACTPDCPPVPAAGEDPLCPPDIVPEPPVLSSPCSCTERVVSARVVTHVPAGTMSRALEAVPLVQIHTGTAEMRRLAVRFYVERVTSPIIGLVVGNSAIPTAGDAAIKARIEGLGYTTNYVDDATPVPDGFDAFVITETATAATLGVKYRDTPLPVVLLDHTYTLEMRMATADGAVSATNTVLDLLPHAVTTGLPDPLTVLTVTNTARSVLNTALPAGAEPFAREGANPLRTVGWVIDRGEALTTGLAPARRAFLGYPDSWIATLTANGWVLFERTLNYVLSGHGCNDLDECFGCSEINLTYVPPEATVTLDGRTRRASVVVPGGVEESTDQYLYGRHGAPLEWPVIDCGVGLCVEVLVDAGYFAPDATVDMYLVTKQDAV